MGGSRASLDEAETQRRLNGKIIAIEVGLLISADRLCSVAFLKTFDSGLWNCRLCTAWLFNRTTTLALSTLT